MSDGFNESDREALRRALAHDLKTPIAVIAGYAELLRLRDDERTRSEAPVRIVEACARLTREIDALLDRLVGVPSGSVGTGLRRILVVDDDEDIRGLLRSTFPPQEFNVLEAADGEQALAAVREGHPDLVILDWELPGLSGGEILAELKSTVPQLGVVVLTANGAHRAQAEELGAERFLTKPFNPVELIRAIEELVRA